MAPLSNSVENESLKMVYHGQTGEICHIPEVLLGSVAEVVLSELLDNIWTLALTMTMLVGGLIGLIISLILFRKDKRNGKKMFFLSSFLCLCGSWCLLDSQFIIMLTGYRDIIFYASFYFFMVMTIPLLYYVINIIPSKNANIVKPLPYLFVANLIGQFILVKAGVFTLFQMLFVTHILMIAGATAMVWALLKEYRATGRSEIRVCVHAFATLGAVALITVILYGTVAYSHYQILFQSGILAMILILTMGLLRSYLQAVKQRIQLELYRQMSEEDELTGLRNRRSFDFYLKEIEESSQNYENIALLFLDINGLKQVNDNLGHEMGDQMIRDMAGCIGRTFKTRGNCYRVGGDEFCAVILNPGDDMPKILDGLTEELNHFNEISEKAYKLSAAWGYSLLFEADGSCKQMSEWKTQADENMYKQKKKMKREGVLSNLTEMV